MKIKITMEAEIDDLPAFNDNGKPHLENIHDVINELYINALEEHLGAMATTANLAVTEETKKFLLSNARQNRKITKRLCESRIIEQID